jgi:hypothetical protein
MPDWTVIFFVCISPMISGIEQFFICLLAICMSSFGKCLFSFFVHFLIGLFICYWAVWVPYIFSHPTYDLQIFSPNVWVVSLPLWQWVIREVTLKLWHGGWGRSQPKSKGRAKVTMTLVTYCHFVVKFLPSPILADCTRITLHNWPRKVPSIC